MTATARQTSRGGGKFMALVGAGMFVLALAAILPGHDAWQERPAPALPAQPPAHAVEKHLYDPDAVLAALKAAEAMGGLSIVSCGGSRGLGWADLGGGWWGIGYAEHGQWQTMFKGPDESLRQAIRNCNDDWRRSLHPVAAPIATKGAE